MFKQYDSDDAHLSFLLDKTIAIIGYGSQGRAHALNLRDSGLNIIIGQRHGDSYNRAISDNFKVFQLPDAVKDADIVCIMLPDESMGEIYKEEIGPYIKSGKVLLFAHGFNIVYGQIVPPDGVDVIMVAPKGPGPAVRSAFLEGQGLPALIAIEKDISGHARDFALAYAKGIGATRAFVYETTFKEETETDLFGEQAVLCGGVVSLLKAAFEVLIKAGYSPECAYFEVFHELKLTVDLLNAGGFQHMYEKISHTAHYGTVTAGPRIITDESKTAMEKILKEIQDGTFAKNWMQEYKSGLKNYNDLTDIDLNHPVEKTGKKVRSLVFKK